ncbi:cell wall hydrolase [Sulfitobacter sp. D35]|uniref:cell wall hydrolase n=1 Tax=Sulfitobacter sp. D35 TaxID=3083252 RepID=UPI00296EC9F4|nr:cell wall hydrolase [Sulfitobacter sp. D35]MDW4499875.1 cell wall hydrolase [Sulfitobacter sp. D35]
MGRLTRAALCVLTAGFLGAGAVAANQVEPLLEQERLGLNAVPQSRIQDFVRPPTSKPQPVNYSRTWLDAQPDPKGGPEMRCLAEALYFEARGETVKGQFAVAEVIMNRVKSTRFPGSACAVINQGTGKKFQCQFTYTCDGHKEVIREKKAFERAAKIARLILDGHAPRLTDGATHYHTNKVSPRWSRVFTRTASIGVHIFYRAGVRTASN